ncbi:MAG TPA: ABC transporter permease [Roseiflexaceae bacterium]|nr:ABC transporter permease [Roseiflexaceae bacterium]
MGWIRTCWKTSFRFRMGVFILLFFAILAAAGPLLYGPLLRGPEFNINPASPGNFRRWMGWSAAHPLGTDGDGRDLMGAYLLGLATSLRIGFLSGVIATAIGTIVGFFAGYLGGWLDTILLTITNVLLIIPAYPILVVLVLYTPRITVETMALILAVFAWPFAARTIRAQVLGMKERPYVDLARISGVSTSGIIFRELLPNLLPYLMVSLAFSTLGAMAAEVGLALIGLGPSNNLSLGLLIFFSRGVFSLGRYDVVLIPPLVLIALFTAITLINLGMEEYLNPRLQNVTGR